MERDDIIRMAREAGLDVVKLSPPLHEMQVDVWMRFATLVAAAERNRIKWNSIHSCHADCQNPACVIVREAVAAEREACAKVCDDKVAAEYATGKVDHNEMGWTQACAIAIRARGILNETGEK